jgi:hypothetical protein
MNKILLQSMIAEGYVQVNPHPSANLFIYNYTSQAQYDQKWNEVTLQCRGLIMNGNLEVVARPLSKFFNIEELNPKDIPAEPFDVFEKLDGSMGILYFIENKPFIATRGSFSSDQAIVATNILYEQYQPTFHLLNPNLTYIFEIIYPANRIVVDYGDTKDLILLAILDTKSGQELPLENIGFPLVKKYDGIEDYSILKSLEEENKEGFVVRFKSGFRLKVKFAEYARLHYIMTNVSNKSIWLHLSENKPLNDILHLVPDEFYAWVKQTEEKLKAQYAAIEKQAKSEFKVLEDRKATAAYFKTCTYPPILFGMLDKKDYSTHIWRMIKPKFEKPFFHRD